MKVRAFPEPNPNDQRMQPRLRFVKVLRQQPEYGPHTVFATVLTVLLPDQDRKSAAANPRDFMQFRMKYAMASDKVAVTGTQTKLISQKAELDHTIGYVCWKYDVVTEDRDVKEFPDVSFVKDFHGYECIAPSSKLIVSLNYSQKLHPEAKPADLSREGDRFLLKSVKFTN